MTKLQKSIDNAIAAIDNCLEICEELKKTLQEHIGNLEHDCTRGPEDSCDCDK